jgi:hypothetical protein
VPPCARCSRCLTISFASPAGHRGPVGVVEAAGRARLAAKAPVYADAVLPPVRLPTAVILSHGKPCTAGRHCYVDEPPSFPLLLSQRDHSAVSRCAAEELSSEEDSVAT